MADPRTPEAYRKAWTEHLGEFVHLGWHLTPKRRAELEQVQALLREIIDDATEDYAKSYNAKTA